MTPLSVPLSRRSFLAGAAASLVSLQLARSEDMPMMIRFAFADQAFTATLEDHASARGFASMLPLDLTISDFSSNEKIAYLPRKLDLTARGPFANPAPGDLCYYIPWGNLALFHGDYVSTRDLIRLGRLDGGVEPLLMRGEFPLRIERLS